MLFHSTIEIQGEGTFVRLDFQHCAYPDEQDYWDGNWSGAPMIVFSEFSPQLAPSTELRFCIAAIG